MKRFIYQRDDGLPAWIKKVGSTIFHFGPWGIVTIDRKRANEIYQHRRGSELKLDRVYIKMIRFKAPPPPPRPEPPPLVFRPPYRKPWEREHVTTVKEPLHTNPCRIWSPFEGCEHIFHQSDEAEEDWFAAYWGNFIPHAKPVPQQESDEG